MTAADPDEGGRDERTAEDVALPGGDFRLFIQKLAYQALISMGIIDNPLTQTRQTNLVQARGLLDDLLMLREKTENNLEPAEDSHLDSLIAKLQEHLSRLEQQGA